MSKDERNEVLSKIINKHQEEILDEKDYKDLRWQTNLFYGSFAYAMMTPIYTIYCIREIRKKPELRQKMMARIWLLPAFSLFTVSWTGSTLANFYVDKGEQYLGQLNDDQLRNFEVNWAMQKVN